MNAPRSFGLAKLIDDASRGTHRPKRRMPHIADEFEAQGNHVHAAELRRHLRGKHGTAARSFLTVVSRGGHDKRGR